MWEFSIYAKSQYINSLARCIIQQVVLGQLVAIGKK